MPSCILTDIGLNEKDLIQLTDSSVPPTTVNMDEVDKAIANADMEVGARLTAKYPGVIDDPPSMVRLAAAAIARWYLYNLKKRLAMPEAIDKQYAKALKDLNDIRDGNLDIGVTPTGKAISMDEAYTPHTSPGRRTFTPGSLDGW